MAGAETIDQITIRYEEDGKEVVREIAKEVLTRGSWTTIVFRYQDFDQKKGDFGPIKASIRRYQKSGGEYKQRSKFNISGGKQARQIASLLQKWFPEGDAEDSEEGD